MSILDQTINNIEITHQVVCDQYHMTLPEFVTYYRELNDMEIGEGPLLRDLYFLINDEIGLRRLVVDMSLTKNNLSKLMESKGLYKKFPGARPKPYSGLLDDGKAAQSKIDEAKSVFVDPPAPTKTAGQIKREAKVEEKVAETPKSGSRKDQVKDLYLNGTTSPKAIAEVIGANPSYVHRLLKQIKDEIS